MAAVTTLWQQVERLEILGGRLGGEAEVLYEIEGYFREIAPYLIARAQIRKILESVPLVFSEDWQSPEGYPELTPWQKEVYRELYEIGGRLGVITGPVIQKVIELGLDYKARAHEPNSTQGLSSGGPRKSLTGKRTHKKK